MANNLWTRDEMILVLNLYLKMPFGKMHKGNADVVKIAHLIGRTPDAVALRLVNFASCDPQLKQRGISGMSHGGRKCEEYWNGFVDDREKLLYESERILAQYEGISIEKKFEKELRDISSDIVGETKIREVKTRVNQNVFRQIVLNGQIEAEQSACILSINSLFPIPHFALGNHAGGLFFMFS